MPGLYLRLLEWCLSSYFFFFSFSSEVDFDSEEQLESPFYTKLARRYGPRVVSKNRTKLQGCIQEVPYLIPGVLCAQLPASFQCPQLFTRSPPAPMGQQRVSAGRKVTPDLEYSPALNEEEEDRKWSFLERFTITWAIK